jgi:Flp pilus assembly protein protease CpaA
LTGASKNQVALGAILALLLTVPGYLLNGLGAGDVKLLVAIACLGGLSAVVVSFVVGSLLVAALLASGTIWQPMLARLPRLTRWVYGPARRSITVAGGKQNEKDAVNKGTDKNIPFGAALAVGLLIQLLWGLDVGG